MFTDRKLDYLQLAAIGLSNEDIANILFVSISTVKSTLELLFKNLYALNRTDAVSIAMENNILPINFRSNILLKYPRAASIYQQKLLNRDKD